MKSALQAAGMLLVLLLVPIVPFLMLGQGFEDQLLERLRQPAAPVTVSLGVISLLALDIFLPVPSSAVITYGGGVLGLGWGTLSAWVGLSAGALGGFGLARLIGEPLARRFSAAEDVDRMRQFVRRHGVSALLVTRALPILAEACVLMLGVVRMPWRQLAGPLLIGNAVLAVIYAACGAWFRDSPNFVLVIVLSGALPLVLALGIRRVWSPTTETTSAAPGVPEAGASDPVP